MSRATISPTRLSHCSITCEPSRATYCPVSLFLTPHSGHGLQGFQTSIKEDTFIVDGMGALGRMHSERGLTYYEVALSGHMCVAFLFALYTLMPVLMVRCRVPQFSPKVSTSMTETLAKILIFLSRRLRSRSWSI